MIEITGLRKDYDGTTVIRDITTTIRKGEVISVIGPSGTGKSTFLRCLNLLETPTAGTIVFEGRDLTAPSADLNEVRRKMGMVFQNFNLFAHLTALENCAIGPVRLLGTPRAEAERAGMELLGMVGLTERANHYPRQLSGGQKQRVAIARCLSMKPDIMLFDEPTSALDPTMVGEVTAVIRNLARDGMTMVLVSHEMDFCRNVSTRVLYLDEGGIYEEGTPAEIFDEPRREKTRTFIRRIRAFTYHAAVGFDFIDMMNRLVYFCLAHAVTGAAANHLQLVVEETVMNLLVPRGLDVDLDAHFPENQAYFEVVLRYGGPSLNVLDAADDDMAAQLAKKIVKTTDHHFTDGVNTLRLRW